ncbi:LPXTG cell wall anchor domain-containing protein [Streptomyces sp. A5-4]|uniref:LPXTG cell wall anchor domain-containing protein n=1 Tax=Streptomyces sp. A5-4 TaxID=3384771 RepID=UPI003DA949E9
MAATLFLPFSASAADEPAPGSSKGGKPGPEAAADVKITTELPERITVDNKTEGTELTAKVVNNGTRKTGPITMAVVGFDGMRVDAAKGCVPIPKGQLPDGSNSGFACVIDNVTAGKSRSYAVTATYDLQKAGRICLPVTEGTGKKLLWQQGPVAFGTSKPTPNAPDTPLLLGTDNTPAAQGGKPAEPSKPGGSAKPGKPADLPSTGVGDRTLALGLAGALLIAAGGAGVRWTARRAR